MINFLQNIMSIFQSEAFFSWIACSVVMLLIECVLLFASVRGFYYHRLQKTESCESDSEMAEKIALEPYRFSQVLLEMLISNTCIISTFWVYSCLMTIPFFQNDYSSYILLLLIVCAIIANNYIDKQLMQDMLSDTDIGNVRLISSISIILLVGVLWLIYRSESCQQFLICYIALVLGRFVFYDTLRKPLKDVYDSCVHAIYLIPLFMALIFTFSVFGLGLYYSVITETNILDSLVLTHLGMILCVYITKRIAKAF